MLSYTFQVLSWRNIGLRDYEDVLNLRLLAYDRKNWQDLFNLYDAG